MSAPGPTCPAHYRYAPASFRAPASHRADTVYVIGGLYGNVEALHAILQMQDEEARRGMPVSLVFNGDHNWFDIDAPSFREINAAALAGVSLRGNVEAELAAPSAAGCGCNYPDYVNAQYVERSNAIMRRLQEAALDFPDICTALGALPMARTIEVGSERIGIVHGDAQSLAGWSFAAERLSPMGKCSSGDTARGELTPIGAIHQFFRDAEVSAFACAHTCLPHARDFDVDGIRRLIMNNGAAGMANFAGTPCGVITRISIDLEPPRTSLYGLRLGGARFDALPVHYDHAAWVERFLRNWPPGSPAYVSYFERIVGGPEFALPDAIGGRVERYASL